MPVTTVPAPRTLKLRSTHSRTSASGSGWRQPVGQPQQFGADMVEIRAERHRAISEGGGGEPVVCLPDGGAGIGQVGLADHQQPVPDAATRPARPGAHRTAASSLRWRRRRTDTAGTGPTPASMLVTNRRWPGTSTNATWRPSQFGPGETEVDGQAAALLFGQLVGPHAGEPVHQGGFAVVDVSGGGYDEHARTAAASSSSCSGGTVRKSSRHRPASKRPTTGGLAARSAAA